MLFQDTKRFLSYTSSFSSNETIARGVFRLKPPKIHWEKNLYTLTQQVGRRNAGDDVKIREENVIDGKLPRNLWGGDRGDTSPLPPAMIID